MRDKWNAIFSFDDYIGFSHGSIKIAMLDDLVCSDVMRCIINIAKIFTRIRMRCIWFMQLRSAFAHGFEWIKYSWQHFKIYLDQAERFFCDGRCFGSDKSDPVTDVTYTAIEQVCIVRR